MTEEEKQELYRNIKNDINCGTYILAPQFVDKLLTEKDKQIEELQEEVKLEKIENKDLIERVNELEAQIEKMRNCENCIKGYSDYGKVCKDCKDFSNWKMKE